MSRRGRPPVLNDDRRRAVCAILSKGGKLVDAAECLQCSVRVLQLEQRRNPQFRQQVQQAKAEALLTPFQILRQAARTNWRAASWMIERADQRRRDRAPIEEYEDYFEPPTAHESPAYWSDSALSQYVESPTSSGDPKRTACNPRSKSL